MKLKEQIANFFTLMNLVCGVGALLTIADLRTAGLFVLAGAVFDLLDGLVARALKITSEIGKQLDSLSDMVTFGVVPGLIANQLMSGYGVGFVAILIPVFSAIRLGKFNIDARQSKDFIGLPTPANALFWASLGIIVFDADSGSPILSSSYESSRMFDLFLNLMHDHRFLVLVVLITSALLVAPFRLMGFKFDNAGWKGNELKIILLIISLILVIILRFMAIPIILLLYILFSIIHFYILNKHEVQS